MGDILPIIVLFLVVIPTIASFNQAKKQAQNQQQQKARQNQAQAKQTKPASVLPPREQTPMRSTLQPTLHDHSGMFDGSLFADDGTEGSDPHDHGFDHEVDMPSAHSEEVINQSLKGKATQPTPTKKPVLDFTPNNIASAFVLQEVLKRR